MLLLVIFASMGAAIGFPAVGKIFSPYPFYLLMILLFFNFLKIEFLRIPGHSGHLFHLIPDSHSSPFRTLCSV